MVIVGNAGMGKSVIAAEMTKRMQEDRRLSGSHFCQHNKVRHRNPKVMLQSLACHLSSSLPEYKKVLVEQLSRNLGLDINDMETEDLFELLFEEPLSRISDPGFTSLVVIDALDESEYQGRNELLEVISNYFNKLPLWMRFLVTTRPEINIWDSLKGLRPLLLEPNDEENLKDIRHLFERHLSHMLQTNNLELILTELVQKSEGVILWAQLLVDFIKDNFSVLTWEHLDSTIPSGISSVYQSYFKRLETELCKELKIPEDLFLSLLSVMVAAREPLPLSFVSKFLFPDSVSLAVQRKVSKAIACISSLLPVQEGCIHFFHKSVKDWLVDESCYGQHCFSVDKREGHRILARLCSDECDEEKRKGVGRSQLFSDVTKYALRHVVQHMLELDEVIRPCSLEEVVNNYVLDVELVYAKLCVDSAIPAEDIACIHKFSVERQPVLENLFFLLRKHSSTLKQLPHVIFQTLLNEGGSELCSEASKLLETKYSNISYMEYLDKSDLQGAVQSTFHCSSEVACFDVSPSSDYMVCECRDGTIQLWSLRTGNLMWKRPVIKMKLYSRYFQAFRTSAPVSFSPHFLSLPLSEVSTFALSCFRSVVFHPTRDAILPGVLSHAYSFDGDLNRLFPESNCVFSVCSISGDTILTDCPDNAKCLIMWSLSNGTEMTRTTRDHDVLTFAWSKDGRLAAVSHSNGSICLVDVTNNFQVVAETVDHRISGMIKFSPDHQFLYCWHCPLRGQVPYFFKITVNERNHESVSLDVVSERSSYEPWLFEAPSESGFAFGDPICCRMKVSLASAGSFVFVLNKQSILRGNPRTHSVEILSLDERTKSSDRGVTREVSCLKFSLNGDIMYVEELMGERRFTAWDVSSGKLNGEQVFPLVPSNCLPSDDKTFLHLVPLNKDVLLPRSLETLELWNFGLTKRIKRWTLGHKIVELVPLANERVGLISAFPDLTKLITFDISRGCEESITSSPGTFIACNSKCQLVVVHPPSILLCQGQVVLWEKYWPPSGYNNSFRGTFSPAEQYFIISGVERGHGVHVLDAHSGRTLHKLWKMEADQYVFVSDEECVILTETAGVTCLRLFNVRSGQQLSLLNIENQLTRLTSSPRGGLIAFCKENCKRRFSVVRLKLRR